MHKRYLGLILVVAGLAAAAFNACGAQPVSTIEVETTAVTTTAETTTETTTTEAATTIRSTTTWRPTTTAEPPTASEAEAFLPVTTTAKPAIYLYPQTPTQVNVTLTLRSGYFTQTIPAYGNGWHVLARPNGKLTNLADGKTYPYLFWEAMERAPWPETKEGFVVAREDLESFLREKLAYMGLIPAEYEEFIGYWLPILSQNEYSLIYFAGEEYTSRYPLEIIPAPDSLLRVFMVARAATGNENVPQQKLKPFARKGFAVIEWGGTIL